MSTVRPFEVIPTTGGEKYGHIHQVLESYLPSDGTGGAIVYCATRRQSEEVAEFLQLKGMDVVRRSILIPLCHVKSTS